MLRNATALVIAVCLSTEALAWGARGHRTVAEIAFDRLTPPVRAQVEALIGPGKSAFVEAATWADAISAEDPEMWERHVVDRPVDDAVYDPRQHCPDDRCLIPSIDCFSALVADRGQPPSARSQALKWLIHLVGEIHQPLHVTHDFDSWGERVWIRIGDVTGNLHWFWDSNFVHALGPTPAAIAQSVTESLDETEIARWRSGTPLEWAEQSFAIARDVIYARSRGPSRKNDPITLSADCAAEAKHRVSRRLAMGGIRLAWTLERLLGNEGR